MTQLDVLGGLLNDGSIWRMKSLAEQGVTAATVRRAVAAGLVVHVSRGTYRSARSGHVPDQDLAEVMARVPGGLVCLHSAAALHGMGDVAAACVWVALPAGRRLPRIEWPPSKFVLWSNPARFEIGVERRTVAGVDFAVTGPARTVVDLLGQSALVGEDRALQCLRDYVQQGGPIAGLADVAERVGWRSRVRLYLKSAAAFGGPR